MEQFKLFIELIRLKKPIGYMLLFWPCAWGLTIGYDFSNGINLFIFHLLLFFYGSILMRSAGCIVNDVADREFDSRVNRTKRRPVASRKISVKLALFYSVLLCLIAFIVLIQFNHFTIALGLISMPLAFTYPLMKRYTYWPQLFLGITFNYGLLLGWTSINNELSAIPLFLYFGAIFWTLGYDTIYGFQDIKDDEIIGLKSTSIKFKNSPKMFLLICYIVFFVSLIMTGILLKLDYLFYILLLIPFVHLFLFQIKLFNKDDPEICLKIFKSNNFFGFLVFTIFLIMKNFS